MELHHSAAGSRVMTETALTTQATTERCAAPFAVGDLLGTCATLPPSDPVKSLAPLSSGELLAALFVSDERVVDGVGEMSLEDAERFEAAVAAGLSACEQLFGRLVPSQL